MPNKMSHDAVLILSLLKGFDALSGVLILGLCQIAYQNTMFVTREYQTLAFLILFLAPICLNLAGTYRPWFAAKWQLEARRLLLGCVLAYSCLLVIGYVLKSSSDFSRVIITTWMIIWPIFLFVFRATLSCFLRHFGRKKQFTRTAVIVGAGALGVSVSNYLTNNVWLGIGVQGLFDDKKEGRLENHGMILGRTDTVADHVREQGTDIVYITLPMRAEKKIKRIVNELADSTSTVYFVPDIFQFKMMLSGIVDYLGDIPAIALWESPFFGFYAVLKRTLDLILGTLILILSAPIMLTIAIAIKFDSPGPIFFAQQRYGLDGTPIMVLKFRTMSVCENGHNFTQCVKFDSRVTKIGAFLRRYSLDELPQFLNVLQGSMSIVGPRPHAVAMNEEYRKLVAGYMLRHKVKPGITGLAQVNGFRGPTDTLDKMEGRIRMDLEYIRTWTPLLDFKIILQTIAGGFTGTNAC